MTETANSGLKWLMRLGYYGRGAVYLTIGVIAIYAALYGGQAEGSSGAFESLDSTPWGDVILVAIAIGILCYVIWRFVDAVMDLEDEGDDMEGYASRAGQAMSGGTHLVLAFAAITAAFGSGGGGGGGTESMTATVMAQPFGRFVIALVAGTTLAVAIYLFYKAWTASYRSKLRRTRLTERLEPLVRFGLAAHGVVLLIIGGLLLYAAWTTNAENAAGFGQALRILENQVYGQILLILAGVGMIGFAAYCGVRAQFGIPPKLNTSDIPTFARS